MGGNRIIQICTCPEFYLLLSGKNVSIPTMRDLYEKISALFDTKDYAGEVKSNLKTALEVRIGSLLRRGVGAMLNTERSIPTIADLLKYPTIIELDYLNQDRANLITFFLLTKIREYIKRQRTEGSGIPEHIILLEEAHNLVGHNLGASSPDDANTKLEARMLAEMRALRESIIIADRLPTAVAAEVVKNTNIKIAHRLVAADDRKDIGQAMLLDGLQMEGIARLSPGESFLYMEGWYRPSMIKIPYENSAKVKLGVESSVTSSQIKSRIQSASWYLQAQTTLLEYSRLAMEYLKSFDNIRKSFDRVDLECNNLRESLGELGSEIFYRLAGDLCFTSASSVSDPPIDSRSYRRLKNLELDDRLSLRDLLELRSDLTTKLELFNLSYQKVVEIDNRIPRDRSKQQWQRLDRQMQTIDRQVAKLCQIKIMSQDEFKDRQELQDKVGEYSEQAEKLGEEQEGHQVDLERLQDRLRALKSSKGVYSDSDRSIAAAVESAVNTRESSVETCKSQMNEVSSRMKTSLENLQRTVPKVQERVARMEELVGSLKHSEVAVNINIEIQTHKDDIEDVNDKSNKIMQMIQLAGNIAAAGTVTANAIGGLVSALQSIGIMR
jgi:hypothetical protein